MTVLEFKDIHRAFKRAKDVLRGLSFSVGPGEVVGLLGRNGAGKTTLMRIAMGLLEAQKGSVRLFGLDPRVDPIRVKRRVGYVAGVGLRPLYGRVALETARVVRGAFSG